MADCFSSNFFSFNFLSKDDGIDLVFWPADGFALLRNSAQGPSRSQAKRRTDEVVDKDSVVSEHALRPRMGGETPCEIVARAAIAAAAFHIGLEPILGRDDSLSRRWCCIFGNKAGEQVGKCRQERTGIGIKSSVRPGINNPRGADEGCIPNCLTTMRPRQHHIRPCPDDRLVAPHQLLSKFRKPDREECPLVKALKMVAPRCRFGNMQL